MSNMNLVNDDEQLEIDVVEADEETVDGNPSDAGKPKTESESKADPEKEKLAKEEAELQAQKERVYEGMLKSWIVKITMKEENPKTGKPYTSEDIRDEKLRETVLDRIGSSIQKKKEEQPSEERIIEKLQQKIELKDMLADLDAVERTEAIREYDVFIAAGNTHQQAVLKTKRLFNVMSKAEREEYEKSFGQRARKVGGAPTKSMLTDEDEEVIKEMARHGVTLSPETYLKRKAEGTL